MTASTATPQLMRDRLLQAVDGQSNICNMMVVVEVISVLEKYPITKEVLEETRLGKLINEIRKKTKNEDLAKRAKKLLRNWQKLIEPGNGELLSRGLTGAPWSSTCISSAASSLSGKTGPELKARSDFNNCTPSIEKLSYRKRKEDQKEGQLKLAKIPKTTFDDKIQNPKQLPSNGLSGCAKIVPNNQAQYPLDWETSELVVKNKFNKIPIHAVKPRPSVPGYKPSTASSLLNGCILQQQDTPDQAASGGQCQSRTPRCSWQSTDTGKQENVKQTVARIQNSPCPGVRSGIVGVQTDTQSGSVCKSPHNSTTSSHSEVVCLDNKGLVGKKRQKYRPKDYMVNLDKPNIDDCTKPVRLKDRQITFDALTGQIKPVRHKESFWDEDVSVGDRYEAEQLNQNQVVPPNPFQQADWKELSKSEIIQAYLSQQSNVLTSSGAHAPRAQLLMTEVFKKEECCLKDAKNTQILESDHPTKDLPGVSREIGKEDIKRLHTQHWSGVNGCYDTKGNWYDWTECISLNPHRDESRLNILPYVCLDYI